MLSISPLPLGLSPRVRGNQRPKVPGGVAFGSIPACAGEPGGIASPTGRAGVYPRVCGGTHNPCLRCVNAPGLSPRVRGNHHDLCRTNTISGSIPACAGEPSKSISQSHVTRVYPRVCGGTPSTLPGGFGEQGLSPRVRGNHLGRAEAEPRRRVYPRVCGGTLGKDGGSSLIEGLSPRVRGNLFSPSRVIAHLGSIPACAGEPQQEWLICHHPRVYPRVCGGTPAAPAGAASDRGLSPRVRGNLRYRRPLRIRQGSIPACAGEP